MLTAFRNALVIPDLRAKLLVTIGLLTVYRLLSFIPNPGIDVGLLRAQQFGQGDIFTMLNFVSGGNFEVFSIAALGVIPYITSSIIMQLLQSTYEPLQKLAREGEEGRKRITQITRYGALGLAAVQALFLAIALLGNSGALKVGWTNGPFFWFVVVVTQVAGSALVMWLGEKITEFGLGNGISLIIYAGIVAMFPGAFAQQFALISQGEGNLFGLIFFLGLLIVAIAGMVMVQQAERRIPVQYARKVVGRKVMGGQSTYIPLKVNTAGVIPVIFATSVLLFPAMIITGMPGSPASTSMRLLAVADRPRSSWRKSIVNAPAWVASSRPNAVRHSSTNHRRVFPRKISRQSATRNPPSRAVSSGWSR